MLFNRIISCETKSRHVEPLYNLFLGGVCSQNIASIKTHSGFQSAGRDAVVVAVYQPSRKSRPVLFVPLFGSPFSSAMTLGNSRYCCAEVPSLSRSATVETSVGEKQLAVGLIQAPAWTGLTHTYWKSLRNNKLTVIMRVQLHLTSN